MALPLVILCDTFTGLGSLLDMESEIRKLRADMQRDRIIRGVVALLAILLVWAVIRG